MKIHEVTNTETLLRTLPLLNLLMTESSLKPVSEKDAIKSFKKAEEQGYKQFYTEDNKDITGVIGLRPFYDPLEPTLGFEINNLIVIPEQRGNGLGSALFQFAIDTAKKEGGNWIRLMVHENNNKAIKFYETNKFKKAANMMWREE